MHDTAPKEKFKNELRSVYKRWLEESDLDEQDMLEATSELIDEDFEEQEFIEFEPEDGEDI